MVRKIIVKIFKKKTKLSFLPNLNGNQKIQLLFHEKKILDIDKMNVIFK